jgi:hypothetical protein
VTKREEDKGAFKTPPSARSSTLARTCTTAASPPWRRRRALQQGRHQEPALDQRMKPAEPDRPGQEGSRGIHEGAERRGLAAPSRSRPTFRLETGRASGSPPGRPVYRGSAAPGTRINGSSLGSRTRQNV